MTAFRNLAAFALVLGGACREAPRDRGQWPMSKAELTQAEEPKAALHYRQYCVGCHGSDGRGNGGVTGADFRAGQSPLRSKSDAELIASVRDGKRGATATMPAHRPVLSDPEIAELIRYVRASFPPADAP